MIQGKLTGKRIGLLTAWASRSGGGVSEAVLAQAAMIRSLGGEPKVFALADRFAEEAAEALAPTPLILERTFGPPQIGFAPRLTRRLLEADLDLLHLHGIWMYPSSAATRWTKATGRPYLISPHGMLDPWITARGRWKKALARVGYERRSWASASLLHALTADEARDIVQESGRYATVVIPNPGPAPREAELATRGNGVVYLGRIHPKKNIAGLIAAWRSIDRPADARLTIAGWGDERDVSDLRVILASANDESICFVGPVYGEEKRALLQSARFLALPSFSEGLPMVVLEAWAAGTPTLMSEACHLPEGFGSGAALRCEPDVAQVADALKSALAMPLWEWQKMSCAAQDLALGPFAAETIARAWAKVYGQLIEGSARS